MPSTVRPGLPELAQRLQGTNAVSHFGQLVLADTTRRRARLAVVKRQKHLNIVKREGRGLGTLDETEARQRAGRVAPNASELPQSHVADQWLLPPAGDGGSRLLSRRSRYGSSGAKADVNNQSLTTCWVTALCWRRSCPAESPCCVLHPTRSGPAPPQMVLRLSAPATKSASAHAVEPPGFIEPLECVLATIGEGGAAAEHHVAHRRGNPELAIGRLL